MEGSIEDILSNAIDNISLQNDLSDMEETDEFEENEENELTYERNQEQEQQEQQEEQKEEEPGDCTICYTKCSPFNTVKTPCNHYYCTDCFFRWLTTNPTCAMCRSSLVSTRNYIRNKDRSDELTRMDKIVKMYSKEISKKLTKAKTFAAIIEESQKKIRQLNLDYNMIEYNKGYLCAMEPDIEHFYEKLKTSFRDSHWTRGFMEGMRERLITKTYLKVGETNNMDLINENERFLMKTLRNYGPGFLVKLAEDIKMVNRYYAAQKRNSNRNTNTTQNTSINTSSQNTSIPIYPTEQASAPALATTSTHTDRENERYANIFNRVVFDYERNVGDPSSSSSSSMLTASTSRTQQPIYRRTMFNFSFTPPQLQQTQVFQPEVFEFTAGN